MKNNAGFSLIELLVVVSILSLISIFTISSFGRNFERQAFGDELTFFTDTLSVLESELGETITDYEIKIGTGRFFSYTYNTLSLPKKQEIEFLGNTGTLSSSGEISLNIYRDNLFLETLSGSSIDFDFGQKGNYLLEASLSGSKLNPIFVNHYGQIESQRNIELVSINHGDEILIIKNSLGQSRQLSQTGVLIFEDEKGNVVEVVVE